MRHKLLYSAAALLLASLASQANADTFQFTFSGPGVSGNAVLTYGTATDAKYPQAFEVTGITGSFTDSNIKIYNAPILGLVNINHATPDPTNLLAPNDFSRFAVASGTEHGSLSFDNLYYPGGSPQTATDYYFSGGFFDIYGLLFDIGDGTVANIWSNGVLPGTAFNDYGVGVATSDKSLDYVFSGVTVTPEPGTFCLLGTGLAAMFFWGRSSLLGMHS